MFAIICRLNQQSIESAIPKKLLTAGSVYAAIGFLERCRVRLTTEPAVFGYDPGESYTVVVQTWDRAQGSLRSLSFGRSIYDQPLIKLIPDPYFVNSNGYQRLRNHADGTDAIRWRDRNPTVVWRGSVTGSGPARLPGHIPRVKLAVACRAIAGTDVAIIGIHRTMQQRYSILEIERFVREAGVWGDLWPMQDFGKYKFTIDIDGHANAWGLLEKLILGCCVLKVGSPYEQWFYHKLRAWEHYVPVDQDLGDLEAKIAWCHENQRECESIAHNGAVLARSLTLKSATYQACFDILAAASPNRGR